MKVVIYNDTTNAFGRVHFGCQLVMESLRELLESAGYDVIGTIPLDDARTNNADKALLSKADLVVMNGEGSYHHDRRPDFARLSKRYPCALVNTVYQDNSDSLKDFKYCAARESSSRDAMAQQVECDLVPDVIFASKYVSGIKPGSGRGTLSVQHYPMLNNVARFDRATSTLQKQQAVVPVIAQADRVITGSFHAACVAAIYGKPMKLSDSNTHKMQGLAKNMGLEYGSNDFMQADPDYVPDARKRISAMIDKLKDL